MIANNPLPSKDNLETRSLKTIAGVNRIITRNNPYPPNFSKTPARTIDPETGAST